MAQQESSAFTRRRREALLGLAPDLPDASTHSHSTFPYEKELRDKKKKRKKKKKEDKDKELVEARRQKPVPNREVDGWLKEIEGLRPDLAALDSIIKKRKTKPSKGESENETDVKDDNGEERKEPEREKDDRANDESEDSKQSDELDDTQD